MDKVVKTHNNAIGIAVLKAVLETNSFHQRGTQVELLERLKGSFIRTCPYGALLHSHSQNKSHTILFNIGCI